mgnify:CR=1 FL=1
MKTESEIQQECIVINNMLVAEYEKDILNETRITYLKGRYDAYKSMLK